MRFKSHYVLFLTLVMLALSGQMTRLKANALTVSNVSFNLAAKTVTFNIGWQNSWRTSVEPNNWDAAWVFVKFRECGSDPNVDWTHGELNTDHTAAGYSFPPQLEPIRSETNVVGIDAVPNNLGSMLRRTAVGKYVNAGNHTVTLVINNLPAVGSLIDLKVFGIEMVYIPNGAFYVGDGNNFSTYSPIGSTTPIYIDNDGSRSLPMSGGYSVAGMTPVNMNAAFPEGFNQFYVMKYEISQGQYADFLNTITANSATSRFPNQNGVNRNTLVNTGTAPNLYLASRPDRAMNFIGWPDISAYFDWSALRPMTETEYEKVCRGPLPPITNEASWGQSIFNTGVAASIISTTTPSENGTEEILNTGANACINNITFTGGQGGLGPLRVGIFAKPASLTRTETGASYYGVMELTGNLWEYAIPVSIRNCVTVPHTKRWGNGYLNLTNGNHDVLPDWPDATVAVVNDNPSVTIRGGSWGDTDYHHLRVSARWYSQDGGYISRASSVGGRGVR